VGAKEEKVVVVGAGPAGALAALYAARAGDDVEVYELRGGEWMAMPTLEILPVLANLHIRPP